MPKKVEPEELQRREAVIMQASCEIIEAQGFSGLTMDKVVGKVPFSKGSVYKLFTSVEEILLAITNDGASVLLEFMERAHNYPGCSRDRNLARAYAYHLYGQLYPTHFFCELQAISPSVREKSSAQRLNVGFQRLKAFRLSSERFVREGVKSGQLAALSEAEVQRVANCSWTAEFGVTSYALATQQSQQSIDKVTRRRLEDEIFWMVNVYMDGLNWTPLSGACDYRATWEHIKSTLFRDEVSKLETTG